MKKLLPLLTLIPLLSFGQADKATWIMQKDNVSGNARVTTRTVYGSNISIVYQANFYPELVGKKILSITDNRSVGGFTEPSRVAVRRVPRQNDAAANHIVSNPDTSDGATNVVHVVPVASLYGSDNIVLLDEAGGSSRSVTIEFQP